MAEKRPIGTVIIEGYIAPSDNCKELRLDHCLTGDRNCGDCFTGAESLVKRGEEVDPEVVAWDAVKAANNSLNLVDSSLGTVRGRLTNGVFIPVATVVKSN